jgi:protein involved in polysaccharide export with SLBB domain
LLEAFLAFELVLLHFFYFSKLHLLTMLNNSQKFIIGQFAALAMSATFNMSAHAQTAPTNSGNMTNGSPANSATVDASAVFSQGRSLSSQVGQQAAGLSAIQPSSNPADTVRPEAQRVQPPLRATEPSQFQRFVQESTGRLLPMYGRELFDAPQAYAADSTLPAPEHYLLAPGDEIRLQVWGPTDFTSILVIDRNGQVNLPKVGVVTLAGVAVRDLDKILQGHLGKVFTNFQSSATMGRLRGIQVYVVGQARQPGTFQLSSLSTLVNALFASGGPNANGSMRNIELKRAGKTITSFDVYDFISRGDKTRDVALLSGDVIVIPAVGPRVAVTGAFDMAAIFELKSSATNVGDILSLGGGVPTLATTQKALLERINRSSNPPRQVQEIKLDAHGLVLPMQDGDVLTLLNISPAFANAVTLQGVVYEPLRHRWFEGMKLLDLIPELDALITSDYYKRKNLLVQNVDIANEKNVGKNSIDAIDQRDQRDASDSKLSGSNTASRVRNISDQINWEYAVIERLNRNTLSTEILPFNLGKLVRGKEPGHNLALQAGDVVTILSQKDLRLPQDRTTRTVRVEGEVTTPGIYQTLPGETLLQLLERAGGTTPQAYLFGTEFNRESVRVRQQENLNLLVRRLESQSQSQSIGLISNLGADRAAQAQALQQQQQAQLSAQIARLRSLKSNGRLALELDPQGKTLASLPNLPLEDGDRIWVPAMPGFVTSYGAVNNENAFVYKQGKTVSDVLASAGVAEDAEPSQVFVLRADGSIIARGDRRSFFSGGIDAVQVMPGDAVVVPTQIDRESRYNMIVRGFKDWTSILSNLGLGVAALKTLRE